MIWLLKDFDLLSVILRGITLALEALTLGGLAFLLLTVLPAAPFARPRKIDPAVPDPLLTSLRRALWIVAACLALAQCAATGLSVAVLVGGSGLPVSSIFSADFFLAGLVLATCALVIALLLQSSRRRALVLCVPPAVGLLAGSIAMSHAASRLDHRLLLSLLTAAHHLGTAGWIGAMAFLLLALRWAAIANNVPLAQRLARRYSLLAMGSVALLVGGGLGMSYFYVGSWGAVWGTSYGLMLVAKTYLLLTMLLLGASNQRLLSGTGSGGLLPRLRRFSEAEIGLGFTAVLAAASLTSQAPAVDLARDRITGHEIIERLRWQQPRLSSPPLAALAPPGTLQSALPQQQFGAGSSSDANDRAWSEYNHHWAGLIVLAAALLALTHRVLLRLGATGTAIALTEAWPLLFLGLAAFILLRADPENWPLGPRPFWASFSRPDVLEHRVYALLIAAFAFFEWAVERRYLRSPGLAYVFPLACAAGGAVLLTHSHGLGNVHEETLAELSHTPIALLGATAGWGRWLELRLPGRREARIASFVWPVCLLLVSLVLLDYREP